MITFIAKRWEPLELAQRISAILYGHLPQINECRQDSLNEEMWHIGTSNDVVMVQRGVEQWRLSFRPTTAPSDEEVRALATLLVWRVGLTDVGVV